VPSGKTACADACCKRRWQVVPPTANSGSLQSLSFDCSSCMAHIRTKYGTAATAAPTKTRSQAPEMKFGRTMSPNATEQGNDGALFLAIDEVAQADGPEENTPQQ